VLVASGLGGLDRRIDLPDRVLDAAGSVHDVTQEVLVRQWPMSGSRSSSRSRLSNQANAG
jgi:hypothetical protein